MDRSRNYHRECSNPITHTQKKQKQKQKTTKNQDMSSLTSGYKYKSSEYPRYNSQTVWSSRRRKTKVWILKFFLEKGTKYSHEVEYGSELGGREEG